MDNKGQMIAFAYDALNRLTVKDLPAGIDVHYYYDEAGYGKSPGQRTRMTDGSGATHYYYDDARGHLTKERKVIDNPGGGTFVTEWGYDASDRVISTLYPGGNIEQAGEQVTTSYDPAGRPYSLTGTATYVQSTTYDAVGRVDVRTLGSNLRRVDSDYYPWTQANGLGRLMRIQTGTAGDPDLLQNLSYTYDAVGNVLSIADAKVVDGTQTQGFRYCSLDRLNSATATGGAWGQG